MTSHIITSTGLAVIAAFALTACGGSGDADPTSAGGSTSSGQNSASSETSSSAVHSPSVDCNDMSLSQADWMAAGCDKVEKAPAPTYTDPVDMKEKAEEALPYLVCQDDSDAADYDITGALTVGCSGRSEEYVGFYVFETPEIEAEAIDHYKSVNDGIRMIAPGAGWAASSRNLRTLDDLQRVLDPENAPEIKPLTKQEAASEYRRMVAPSNEAKTEFDYIDEYSEVDEYQSACITNEDAMSTFADELEFAAWPSNAKDLADTLAKEARNDVQAFQKCVDSSSVDAANAALGELTQSRDTANAFRSALGLKAAE